MVSMKLISWNVNGIRSAYTKGFPQWLANSHADVIALQETKAQAAQLGSEFIEVPGYRSWWADAEKKGYSGVCVYAREPVLEWGVLEERDFDREGRTLRLEFDSFTLFNCYFPNSQDAGARLDYKLAFCQALKEKADAIRKSGRMVLICGDYNIAHKAIDLEYPKANEGNPGYLPEERAWMDSFIEDGWTDTFRMFNSEPRQYSWWSYRTRARERNIGWRIDYFCTGSQHHSRVKAAGISQDVSGSDHCPVWVEIE